MRLSDTATALSCILHFSVASNPPLEKGLQRRSKVAKSHLNLSTACAVNPGVVIVPVRFTTNVGVDLPVFMETRMFFIVASRRVLMLYLALLQSQLSDLLPQVPILTLKLLQVVQTTACAYARPMSIFLSPTGCEVTLITYQRALLCG